MKVYIGEVPDGSSKNQPYITLEDPPYIPRVGEFISVKHDPILHKVKSVCHNISDENSITITLEGQDYP